MKKIGAIRKPSFNIDEPLKKSTQERHLSISVNDVPTPEKAVDSFLKARKLADQGQLPEALEWCEIFLGENPVHAEAHFLMGLIYEALNDEEKAESFFNRAIYLNPNHVEALNHMAFIELQRGNQNGAERLRQRARRIRDGRTTFSPQENGISGIQNGK